MLRSIVSEALQPRGIVTISALYVEALSAKMASHVSRRRFASRSLIGTLNPLNVSTARYMGKRPITFRLVCIVQSHYRAAVSASSCSHLRS